MSEWDQLTPAQRQAVTVARKRGGHTSVFELERVQMEAARAQAFGEACDFLKSRGYFEASAVLEAAAFDKTAPP